MGTPSWGSITGVQFAASLKNATIEHSTEINFGPLKENYAGGAFNRAQVVLTFDGSWNSILINATPIMKINHQTGVAYLVANQIGDGAGTDAE